ncbi:MAG: hypothetical protein P1S46_07530 [bacterium]|nr:hypothetical protein [bacterium]
MKKIFIPLGIMMVSVVCIVANGYGFSKSTHEEIVGKSLTHDAYLNTYLKSTLGFTNGINTIIDSHDPLLNEL